MNRVLFLFVIFILSVAALPLSSTPVQAATLTVAPTSGTIGAMVTVRGIGFTGSLVTIYYDKLVVASKIRISEVGEFTATFNIPESSRGNHRIKAVDNAQPVSNSAETDFAVLPKIRVEPAMARIGASVAITGSGFARYESGIRVTLDGREVATSIKAGYLGSWGFSLTVPPLSKGDHTIGAFGGVTEVGEVADAVLTVGPVIRMVPGRGPVGTSVRVNGLGFGLSEDTVNITYDDQLISYNLEIDSDGSWEAEFNIPPSTAGAHRVDAYTTFTYRGTIPSLIFEVVPEIEITPDSAKAGEEVKVSGTGFGGSQTIKLSMDKVEVGTVTSDVSGSFEATFQAPQSNGVMSKVTAVDGLGNSAEVSFTLLVAEETPPPVPGMLLPEGGSQVRVFTSALAAAAGFARNFKVLISKLFSSSAVVSFDWSDVTDPSGVSYTLQIATTPEFSLVLVDKEELASSEYTLSGVEALSPGDYYWRVRAVDGAGNMGQWSEAQQFQVRLMTTRSLVVLIISMVFLIAVLVFGFLFWRARRAYYL